MATIPPLLARLMRGALGNNPVSDTSQLNLNPGQFYPDHTSDPLQDNSTITRLLADKVNASFGSSSLAAHLAFPLGAGGTATILFDYETVPVGDKINTYNAPFVRYSAGNPLTEGSYVIDVVYLRGPPNHAATQMFMYSVTNGILT